LKNKEKIALIGTGRIAFLTVLGWMVPLFGIILSIIEIVHKPKNKL